MYYISIPFNLMDIGFCEPDSAQWAFSIPVICCVFDASFTEQVGARF